MSTTVNTSEHAIVRGPSHDLIVDAFKYAFPADQFNPKLSVEFQISISQSSSKTIQVQVTGIRYESRRGGKLLIDGNILGSRETIHSFYDTTIRQGTATITH